MSKLSNVSGTLFLFNDQRDMSAHLEKVIGLGKKSILIFNRTLNPTLFNHQAIADSISKLSRGHRNAEVKLLIQSTDMLINCNHYLLQLSRRLPSKIKLQKIYTEPEDDISFVIVDDDKLWLQHREDEYTGFANYDAKPEVNQFKRVFDELWRHSQVDPELRQLSL